MIFSLKASQEGLRSYDPIIFCRKLSTNEFFIAIKNLKASSEFVQSNFFFLKNYSNLFNRKFMRFKSISKFNLENVNNYAEIRSRSKK